MPLETNENLEKIDLLLSELKKYDVNSSDSDLIVRELFLEDVGRKKHLELIAMLRSGQVGDLGASKILFLLRSGFSNSSDQNEVQRNSEIRDIFHEYLSSPLGEHSHGMALSSINNLVDDKSERLDLFESSLPNSEYNDAEIIFSLKLNYVAGSDDNLPKIMNELMQQPDEVQNSLIAEVFQAHAYQVYQYGDIANTDLSALSTYIETTKPALSQDLSVESESEQFLAWLNLKHISEDANVDAEEYFLNYMEHAPKPAEIASVLGRYVDLEELIPAIYKNSPVLQEFATLHLASGNLPPEIQVVFETLVNTDIRGSLH